MADVFEVCDRATVMKNGQLVDTVNVPDDTQVDVLGMIILGQKPKARAV
jgi:D-xylose transport system ATP-binding protein